MAAIIDQDIDGNLLAGIYKPMLLELKEKYDVRAAQWVCSLSDAECKELFWSEGQDQGEARWKSADEWTQYHKRGLAKAAHHGFSTVKYGFALNRNSGRLYPAKCFGVQGAKTSLRSLLVRDYVEDLDMVNAHPALLLYLCEKNNVECNYLREYVQKRDDVLESTGLTKQQVLIAMYSDKVRKDISTGSWFTMYSTELMQIRNWFDNNRDNFPKADKEKPNKQNPKSSFLSCIINDLENEVLMLATQQFKHVHTYVFDGFHLDKAEYHGKETIQLLNATTAEYGITWKHKPFDQSIQVPDVFDNEKWRELASDYESAKLRLEVNNAKIMQPAGFVSRPNPDSPYVVCSQEAFKHKTSHITYENEKGKKTPIFNNWMMDEKARVYDTIDFIPQHSKCPSSTFNLFECFPCKETTINTSITSIVHEHLRCVIADGDEAVYNYLLYYEAHMVQKTCELPKVAILLKGGQGDGKDSLVDKWERLVGKEHCHRSSDIQDMVGNFNSALRKKIVIQHNELGFRDGLQAKEAIKDYITRERYDVNEKHQPRIDHGNYLRHVITTNNFLAVEIPYDDRRFAAMKVSSVWRGNTEKFDTYHASIRDRTVMDSYYTELMQRDISCFDPRVRPMTSAYKIMQQHCIPDVYKVLRDHMVETVTQRATLVADRIYISPTNFKELYLEWLINEGFDSSEYPRKLVIKQLAEVPGVNVDTKYRFDGRAPCRAYLLNVAELKQFIGEVFA
jgi:hypothetical protein